MRKPSIPCLAARASAAFSHAKLRVVISLRKGVVRIDAQSAIAIAAAVLIIGMIVPRNPDGILPTHTVPARIA